MIKPASSITGFGTSALIPVAHGETIPAAWKALVLWWDDSGYKMGKEQCLEQHLGSASAPQAERPMDMYLSIE